jgi:hypothetical protein
MKKLSGKGAKALKAIHLVFVALWVGGAISLLPLLPAAEADFSEAFHSYRSMRAVAWNVVGWGGIGSFFTGLLNALLTNWGLFRHRWIVVKFLLVIGQILFGMFFIEHRIISNLALLETGKAAAFSPEFFHDQALIRAGLFIQLALFIFVICISIFKPWSKKPAASQSFLRS